MTIKKILAAVFAAAVMSTLAVAVANAAVSFGITTDRHSAMPSDQVVVTADDECAAAGGTLQLLVDDVGQPATHSGNTLTWTVAENTAGLVVQISANCLDDDDVVLGTSNEVALTVFGAEWVVSHPEVFTMGEPVTFTAGDFTPGSHVTLSLLDASGAQQFSGPLGTAGDDFSVSGTVTFPTDLEPGDYVLHLTDGTLFVTVTLTVHPEEDEAPTPGPEPEPSQTSEPTGNPSSTPSPQPGAGAAPSPGGGGASAPGLPSTGH